MHKENKKKNPIYYSYVLKEIVSLLNIEHKSWEEHLFSQKTVKLDDAIILLIALTPCCLYFCS